MQQRYQNCRHLQYDALRRERLVLSFQFLKKSAAAIFYSDRILRQTSAYLLTYDITSQKNEYWYPSP